MAAREWALSMEFIKSNNYVELDSMVLAQKISRQYGTTFHSDFVIKKDIYDKGCTHFWLANSEGEEIFNPAGLGWHGE